MIDLLATNCDPKMTSGLPTTQERSSSGYLRASANISRQNDISELRPPFETANQAIDVDDAGSIRQRLLVRNRDQGVCENNRDSVREQVTQGRTGKGDQDLP